MEIKYFTSSIKDLGEHKIAYTEWGNPHNHKVVMCVHGLSRNSRDFDYLAAKLADHYRVICVDVVGRGMSDWLPDPKFYTYSTYVSDIKKLILHLNIKKLDWVGTSMGSIIGMTIDSQEPGLIGKMVLNDIGPFIPEKSLKRIAEYLKTLSEFDNINDARDAMRLKLSSFGITKDEHWQHIFDYGIVERNGKYYFSYDPRVIKTDAESIANIKDVDLWEMWKGVTSPILLIRGELSEVLQRETAMQMIASRKPDGHSVEFVELPNIGHVPALMENEQINIIKDWLL